MYETISVRLVPKRNERKSYSPENLSRHSGMPGAASAPAEGPADEALRLVRSMQINAEKTPGNAIHAEITTEQAQTLFGVKLTPKKEDQPEAPYLFAREALHVPDVLASTVDFAYIPTPPRYFFPATVNPPLPNAHYLTLDDVLKKLNGHLCHRNGWRGDGVKVAIVDTGFGEHPFFDAHPFNIRRIAPKKVQDPCDDSDGHGTGVCANLLTLAPKCRFIGVKKGARYG
jgi:subtilisin family serine protease